MGKTKDIEVSKIELAKALKVVKGVASSDDYERVKAVIIKEGEVKEGEVDDIIKGLSEEDEFALMCKLMGTTDFLVHLEQRPIIEGDYIVPDFLALFNPNCTVGGIKNDSLKGFRCLIEVKTTNKKKYKIGGAKLERLRNFADLCELPLLFAVRLSDFKQYATWIIKKDTVRKSRSLEVKVNDMLHGMRRIVWDEYAVMILPNVYFRVYYDKSYNGLGIENEEYGKHYKFEIISKDQVVFEFTDVDALVYYVFFKTFGFQDVQVYKEGSKTCVIKVPKFQLRFLSDIVYRLNIFVVDDEGKSIYDASKILVRSDIKSHQTLLTRNFVENVTYPLYQARILGMMGLGNGDEHIEKWREYFADNTSDGISLK